jgi:hypothetical protein
VIKTDSIRRELEEVFEGITRNKEYLKKEIVEDLKYAERILEYDLLVSVPHVKEGPGNDGEAEIVKFLIE